MLAVLGLPISYYDTIETTVLARSLSTKVSSFYYQEFVKLLSFVHPDIKTPKSVIKEYS